MTVFIAVSAFLMASAVAGKDEKKPVPIQLLATLRQCDSQLALWPIHRQRMDSQSYAIDTVCSGLAGSRICSPVYETISVPVSTGEVILRSDEAKSRIRSASHEISRPQLATMIVRGWGFDDDGDPIIFGVVKFPRNGKTEHFHVSMRVPPDMLWLRYSLRLIHAKCEAKIGFFLDDLALEESSDSYRMASIYGVLSSFSFVEKRTQTAGR